MTHTQDVLPYRHRQVGAVVIVGLGGGIALTAAIVALTWNAPGPAPWIAGLVSMVLVACLVLVGTLTVEVSDDAVRVAFGPGVIRRTIAVAGLRAARAVRNRWWYGWGIRLTPYGWLWNVSGLDAVEVEFEDGRKFRIGTDDPGGLVAAIQHGIDERRGNQR